MFEKIYGLDGVELILRVVQTGDPKKKDIAVAALDRLATQLTLPATPGAKGNNRAWNDWAEGVLPKK